MSKPTKTDRKRVHTVIAFYVEKEQQSLLSIFKNQLLVALQESEDLRKHIHSIKSRIKDPDHLRDKLIRKICQARENGEKFDIKPENLFAKIGDLVGIRILHLYTHQFAEIDKALREIFHNHKYRISEGPFARTWDDESRDYFRGLRIKLQKSPTLYTSVHYLIESASRAKVICEIQVRTLMEEVWGEVDHAINYPEPIDSIACREQIKALARATSSATRLVDSIFATVEDLERKRRP
jgi:ppGpp synthetase/RelA/SpoT-type nucleotidyltranferase